MTETAAMADIVLPATTFLEHDDIYHGQRPHLPADRRARWSSPTGEARANHYVICELAQAPRRGASRLRHDRVGAHRRDAEALRLARCGRRSTPSTGTIARWLSRRRISSTASAIPTGSSTSSPTGRAIGPDQRRALPALPDQIARHRCGRRRASVPPGGGAGALVPQHQLHRDAGSIASARRAADRAGPSRRLRARSASPRATACGSATGRARVVVHARPFDGLQPGVVVVESIWPNAAFEEGIGINTLISADAGLPQRRRRASTTPRSGCARPSRVRRPAGPARSAAERDGTTAASAEAESR